MAVLPVKLEKEVKGSDLIEALTKAANKMNLESKVGTAITGAKLGSVKFDYVSHVIIGKKVFFGLFETSLACVAGINPDEKYTAFSLWPISISSFSEGEYKQYLDNVSEYLKALDKKSTAS